MLRSGDDNVRPGLLDCGETVGLYSSAITFGGETSIDMNCGMRFQQAVDLAARVPCDADDGDRIIMPRSEYLYRRRIRRSSVLAVTGDTGQL